MEPPRSPKRAANWSQNINHAFFQRELSCHSSSLSLSLSLSPDRPDSTDAVSIFLTEASPPPPLSRASFTEMLSAFVFSRRTAKREASNSGEGKLSSATAFSPEGQQGNEEECPKNALKTLNAGVWRDSEHELDSWRMWAFAD